LDVTRPKNWNEKKTQIMNPEIRSTPPNRSPAAHLKTLSLALALGLATRMALGANLVYKQGAPDPVSGATYTGAQDTTLISNSGGSQAQNFGGRGDVAVGGTSGFPRHALMRFDISSLNSQFSAINSVKLRIYVEDTESANNTLQVFLVSAANA